MFQQQNPRRLFQSDMECDDLIRKNMCVDAMSLSGTDGGISIGDEDQCGCSLDSVVSVAPAEVQRAPPVDALNASVCVCSRRVPNCEERPPAVYSRRDRCCVAGRR